MTSVLIEGWRGINHSYALVNQFQLLALLRRGELDLFHRDLPFFRPEWSASTNPSGFKPADAGRIAALVASPVPTDVVLRIAFPCRLYGGEAKRIFCFGTCEAKLFEADSRYDGAECNADWPNRRVEIVTPSHWSKQGFLAAGFDEADVHVVPHGIEPAYFHPLSPVERAAARADLGLKDEDFVFLNVGAMTDNKGIDLLLLAFAEVRRRHPRARLLLKDQQNLYGISAQEVIREVDRRHPGRLSGDVRRAVGAIGFNFDLATLRQLYGAVDAYVSPYRAEGFNLPPLEAAACGTPIAVTAGGPTDDYADASFALSIAAKEISRPDGCTELAPDLESVIAAMEALIEKRTPGIDTAAGAKKIAATFTWDHAAAMLSTLFAG